MLPVGGSGAMDNMSGYRSEDSNYATRKFLEPFNQFDKFAGYKIYTEKSLALIY